MVQIFIVHSEKDTKCAEQLRQDLQAEGYQVWQADPEIAPNTASYPRMIEDGIRGSAAVVLLWSAQAAASEWVEREILFAQRLRKPVLPVLLDGTDLPVTITGVEPIRGEPSCQGVGTQVAHHLPPAEDEGVFYLVLRQVSHPYIRERKAGIVQAMELLEAGVYREEILALIEDVARKDLMTTVQEEAQAMLNAVAQKDVPPVPENASRHTFGVRCQCGHVTYFDRRRVCPASSTFQRNIVRRADAELDEIYLPCEACDEEMVVRVDCEGYK